MAKKTVRTTKPTQQKSKEEQWRKRMAAQARTGSTGYATAPATRSAVVEPDEEMILDGSTGEAEVDLERQAVSPARRTGAAPAGRATATATPTTPARSAAAGATRTAGGAAAAAAAARRTAAPTSRTPVGARGRAIGASQSMSIEEEMHFVRQDIRKLIILTAICIVILIALAFIVPSIVR